VWNSVVHLALQAAGKAGDTSCAMLQLLIEHGCEVDEVDGDGRTGMHEAAAMVPAAELLHAAAGLAGAVRAFEAGVGYRAGCCLAEARCRVDTPDAARRTSLHVAVAAGNVPLVALLLGHGANPELPAAVVHDAWRGSDGADTPTGRRIRAVAGECASLGGEIASLRLRVARARARAAGLPGRAPPGKAGRQGQGTSTGTGTGTGKAPPADAASGADAESRVELRGDGAGPGQRAWWPLHAAAVHRCLALCEGALGAWERRVAEEQAEQRKAAAARSSATDEHRGGNPKSSKACRKYNTAYPCDRLEVRGTNCIFGHFCSTCGGEHSAQFCDQ